MPQIFYFMLKVILCSGILFGYYHLFLKNKVYHAYNRYYLLGAVLLSLIVPTIKFDIYNSEEQTQLQPIQMLNAVNNSDAYLGDIIAANHSRNVELSDILMAGYIAIGLILLVSFLQLLFRMYSLIRKSEQNILNNIVLIKSTAEGTPFSFFKYLFWNNEIDINTETGRHIFSHELAHIHEKHSLDKIFLNVVLVFCWINPFFWLIRKELNMIHEFIADKKAVGQYDTAVLASMIIKTAYPKHNFLITNHFFYSPIKRRLEMLAKYKSTRATYFTRILALPILFILIAAFTFKAKDVLKATTEKEFIVVVDAGHGGNDGGAMAHDGAYEKDINLALAKKVLALNDDKQVKIILTRESDIYQTPQEKANFAQKMQADLFVSIHVSTDPSASRNKSGMEVYIPGSSLANSAPSKVFASALINTFATSYDLKVSPNPIERPTGIWVLKANTCPAVLIEAGFISNKKDRAYLSSAAGQGAFADNLLEAIRRYVHEVENLGVENLEPTVKFNAPTAVTMKDFKNDTLPKNRSSTDATVIDNAEIIIQNNDADADQNAIVVIGGKIYDVKALNNKTITGKRAKLYGKNNTMIIEKYGKRAKDGAIIFEEGAIKDLPSGRYDVVIDRANKNLHIDASQLTDVSKSLNEEKIHLNGLKTTMTKKSIMLSRGTDSLHQPLYLLDGKKILLPTLQAMDPKLIKSIKVLKGETAELEYGVEAKSGAIMIESNALVDKVSNDPIVSLSGLAGPRIHLSQLKNIKQIDLSDGYKLISATFFFSGPGFPNVITAQLNQKSLAGVQTYMERMKAGSRISMDNIQVENHEGKRTIKGVSYEFYQ